MTQQQVKDVVAGLAIFFSMSYVVFAVPLMLGQVHFPATPVFYATCLISAAASWAAGRFAQAPTAVAPGLALSASISQFLSLPDNPSTWESALVVCFFAGCFLLLTSLTGFRRKIADSIPPIIKLALTGGIGAVLAENALKFIRANPDGSVSDDLLLFVAGLVFIGFGYIVLRNLSVRAEQKGSFYARLLDTCGRASLFLSVPLIALLAHLFFSAGQGSLSASGSWIWLERTAEWKSIFRGAINPASIMFGLFVLYILYADIVGSPYQMALDDVHYETQRLTEKQNDQIRRSYIVDSLANMLAPLFGTSPPVYYAENLAGKVVGGKGPLVAYVTAGGFLLIFLVGVLLAAFGKPIEALIPGIAVAPVLFFVGLVIIAKSLARSTGRDILPSGIHREQLRQDTNPDTAEFLETGRYMPAAVTIIATPIAGFEVGVACGILSYYLFFVIFPAEQKEIIVPDQGALHVFALFAFLALALKLHIAVS